MDVPTKDSALEFIEAAFYFEYRKRIYLPYAMDIVRDILDKGLPVPEFVLAFTECAQERCVAVGRPPHETLHFFIEAIKKGAKSEKNATT